MSPVCLPIVLSLFALTLGGSASAGPFYYYEDDEGTVRVSDEPPEVEQYQVRQYDAVEAFRVAIRKYSKEELRGLIASFSSQMGIDAALVEAVVKAESEYDPTAVSRKGARGLMQLMPATAESLGVTDVHDPRQNLRGGIVYLKRLLDRFDGNVDLAVAAYNAGEGAVRKYGGIPPFAETIDYVGKVRKYYARFADLSSRSVFFDASLRNIATR